MKITSLTNKNVMQWRELKTSEGRKKFGQFLVEGEKLVNEANKNGLLSILIYNQEPNLSIDSKVVKVEVDKKVMNKLSSLVTPPKVIGVCNFREPNIENPNVIVAFDGVQDPGNGGTIIRTCLAFNFKKVLVSKDNFDLYNDKFIRATMGSFFKVDIEKVDLYKKLTNLKESGYKIIVTDLNGDSNFLKAKNFKKMVIVFGSEGQGISERILELADLKLKIEINKELESLNVASAAAITLYEINKIRG